MIAYLQANGNGSITIPKKHIDWRWEFLCAAILSIMELWGDVVEHFDYERMISSDGGKLDRKLLKKVQAIKDDCLFYVLLGIFLTIGQVVERCASRLEGCECHKHIWTNKRKFEALLKEIRASTGFDHCVWKWRQGAWWVAYGLQWFLDEIMHAESDALTHMLAAAAQATRTQALQLFERLRNKLAEIVKDKFSFWLHIPYRCIGIFSCILGGTMERSKEILRECIAEYDAVLAQGYRSSLHRVAYRLLDSMSACGRELREWLADDTGKTLEFFPHAFVALQEYALLGLVERRIESVHAHLKRILRKVTYILPSTLCAFSRETYNIKLLTGDSEFHAFCLREWRRRGMCDALLTHRVPEDELKGMKNAQKQERIYQFSLDQDFANMDVAKAQHDVFERSLVLQAPKPVEQPVDISRLVGFLKELFGRGDFYSLPVPIFEAWKATAGSVDGRVEGASVNNVLQLADEEINELPRTEKCAFFFITHTTPEARYRLPIFHTVRSRSTVMVSEALVSAARPAFSEFTVQRFANLSVLGKLGHRIFFDR